MKLYPYIVFNFNFNKKEVTQSVKIRRNSELANQEI